MNVCVRHDYFPYDESEGCPYCTIAELEAENVEIRRQHTEMSMWKDELKAQVEAAKEYVNNIDGLPGSQNWRIKTDILAALEQGNE